MSSLLLYVVAKYLTVQLKGEQAHYSLRENRLTTGSCWLTAGEKVHSDGEGIMQDYEAAGHIVCTVRNQVTTGTLLTFSFLCIQDPKPWNGAPHTPQCHLETPHRREQGFDSGDSRCCQADMQP